MNDMNQLGKVHYVSKDIKDAVSIWLVGKLGIKLSMN